jgi:hypothetical protein
MPLLVFTSTAGDASSWNPVAMVYTELALDWAVDVLKDIDKSVPETMPRTVSQKYQFPVVSVRLIITNLAPPVKPQLMVVNVPVPV